MRQVIFSVSVTIAKNVEENLPPGARLIEKRACGTNINDFIVEHHLFPEVEHPVRIQPEISRDHDVVFWDWKYNNLPRIALHIPLEAQAKQDET